jgi:plastocyanin
MNKTFPILIIILIFAVIVGAYAFTQTNTQIMLNSSANMSNMNATIIIKNGTLNPANLTVKPNTVVVWTNEDPNSKYMITSQDKNEGTYLFMSDHLSNGQSFSFKFIGNGTYDYYDMDHMGDDNLTGTITVT